MTPCTDVADKSCVSTVQVGVGRSSENPVHSYQNIRRRIGDEGSLHVHFLVP